MKRKAITILVLTVVILMQSHVSALGSDYEFYLFGINLKVFKDSNWMEITAGAISSIMVHELGHVLYLESQKKDWNLSQSSSGIMVHTNSYLTDRQQRNFGRSGFALQTGIGALLTSFESTKFADFTKGWVFMNTTQLWTYEYRHDDDEGDFALIERGNGDWRSDFGMLAGISYNNLAAISHHDPILSAVSDDIGKSRNEIEQFAMQPSKKH